MRSWGRVHGAELKEPWLCDLCAGRLAINKERKRNKKHATMFSAPKTPPVTDAGVRGCRVRTPARFEGAVEVY